MKNLKTYKTLPEWTAETLPKVFQEKHNTKEGTWAELKVFAGSLRFTNLTEDGEVTSSLVLDAETEAPLVAPHAWHKVDAASADLRCQLSFLCEADRYLEKKYKLTAPHSEVRALLPELLASEGRQVLDLGCGRGRNSFFLKGQGFEMVGVDKKEASLETLRTIQDAEGIAFAAHAYNIDDAALEALLPDGKTDHIISTVVFQFLQAERVPSIIENMHNVTRPGGLHLIVAPITSEDLPCPMDFPHVFQAGELRRYYEGWQMLRYEETIGHFHRRDEHGNRYKSRFVTMVARKPG